VTARAVPGLPDQSNIGNNFNENDPTTTGYNDLRIPGNSSGAIADDRSPPAFRHYGDIALFYVGDGFFTVILIYPYENMLARFRNTNNVTIVNLPEVKFNRTIMLDYSINKTSSGLLKVADTGKVDLDGEYPERKESELLILIANI